MEIKEDEFLWNEKGAIFFRLGDYSKAINW